MHLAGVVLMALGAMKPALAAASDLDLVPGQERQVVYYSIWGDCIGNPRTPLCTLETLFSCMVRSDRGMCATVGVADENPCRPAHITGVRYIVDRVTEAETIARVTFRAQVCRGDMPCGPPSAVEAEDLDRVGDRWRFRSNPQVLERLCRPIRP